MIVWGAGVLLESLVDPPVVLAGAVSEAFVGTVSFPGLFGAGVITAGDWVSSELEIPVVAASVSEPVTGPVTPGAKLVSVVGGASEFGTDTCVLVGGKPVSTVGIPVVGKVCTAGKPVLEAVSIPVSVAAGMTDGTVAVGIMVPDTSGTVNGVLEGGLGNTLDNIVDKTPGRSRLDWAVGVIDGTRGTIIGASVLDVVICESGPGIGKPAVETGGVVVIKSVPDAGEVSVGGTNWGIGKPLVGRIVDSDRLMPIGKSGVLVLVAAVSVVGAGTIPGVKPGIIPGVKEATDVSSVVSAVDRVEGSITLGTGIVIVASSGIEGMVTVITVWVAVVVEFPLGAAAALEVVEPPLINELRKLSRSLVLVWVVGRGAGSGVDVSVVVVVVMVEVFVKIWRLTTRGK
jgi:hypothetical protein